MPNVDTPFGLKPLRYKSGLPYNGAAVPMLVSNLTVGNMFIGDPVLKTTLGSNTTVETAPGVGTFPPGTLPLVEKATAGDGNRITGVIVGVAASPTDLERQFRLTLTNRIVFVAVDPQIVFEIQADGVIAATDIGANANLIFTNPGSIASGISGVELDTALIAPDASNQLLILQVSNRIDVELASINPKLEVLINQHTENQGTVGSLGV